MTITIHKDNDHALQLTIDGIQLEKFKDSLNRWSFKDPQSLLSFMIALVSLNEDPFFKIRINNVYKNMAPPPWNVKPRSVLKARNTNFPDHVDD